jgi:hypothetical protein
MTFNISDIVLEEAKRFGDFQYGKNKYDIIIQDNKIIYEYPKREMNDIYNKPRC